jgi:hypothetical protein
MSCKSSGQPGYRQECYTTRFRMDARLSESSLSLATTIYVHVVFVSAFISLRGVYSSVFLVCITSYNRGAPRSICSCFPRASEMPTAVVTVRCNRQDVTNSFINSEEDTFGRGHFRVFLHLQHR